MDVGQLSLFVGRLRIRMTDTTVAVDDDVRALVQSFLQSVVVLDDRPFMSEKSGRTPGTPSARTLTRPDYGPAPAVPAEATPPDDLRGGLDAAAVINGFADVGLVCAILNPTPIDNSQDNPEDVPPIRVTKAAVRADIVVIDWKIKKSHGETALRIVKDILDVDREARRFRLLAIYTGEPKLQTIATEVCKLIDTYYPEDKLTSDHPARISKGPVHVAILAKEGTIGEHGAVAGFSEVTESDLASKLVNEFMSMTSGILPHTALAGVAAIRNRAHNLLAKFDRELDPAFLGHRMLLPYPPDAEDHLVEVLAAEIFSILEDNRPGVCESAETIRVWLERSDKREWLDVILLGVDSPDIQFPQKQGSKDRFSRKEVIAATANLFVDDETGAINANHRFAALLGTKTRYPGCRSRRLALGTIVWQVDGDQHYWLCLQPKCDSIRLKIDTGFPMIPLHDVDAHDEQGARKAMELVKRGNAIRLVLERTTDDWKDLYVLPTPSRLVVPRFRPGPNPPGEVVAVKEDGVFYFEDTNGHRYQWIAEIKDEHATKVAGVVASALARPGPNDAEWLRRGVRGGKAEVKANNEQEGGRSARN